MNSTSIKVETTWYPCKFYTMDSIGVFSSIAFVFPSQLRTLHSNGNVIITYEGLKMLIYTRQLWPLSNEGSFAYQTDWDTVHPFIWSSHRSCNIIVAEHLATGAVTTCITNQVCTDKDLNTELPNAKRTV